MALKLYNTFTKSKEEFKPLHAGKISLYSCGPTVYDYIHIGNIKAYLNADILRRHLGCLGYEVRHIKNITDVGHLTEDDIGQGDSGEDKIAKKAAEAKKTPEEFARFYEKRFKEDEKEMNILPAHFFPRATAHIPQMIKIISALIKKGYAYEKNGNVFFDVVKFKDYGKLSGNTLENLKVGARLEKHPDKKNPWDFALWLSAPKEHLMKWDSPWGIGYPGWHIECSAMGMEYLGDTIDIHTGGEDNIFPHHEAEIAQSETYSGKKFVNFWFHSRHLLVDGEKMAKSKNNFYTLGDIKKKKYDPTALRLAILSSHYRSQMNFTWDVMKQAKENSQKISDWLERMDLISNDSISMAGANELNIKNYKKRFEEAMDDDLNSPLALSVLYELITETNTLSSQSELGQSDAKDILGLWEKMNKVFGLVIQQSAIEIPEEIQKLSEERKTARENKDFKKSDELRKIIEEKGYAIEDTKNNNYSIKQNG